MPRQPVNRTLGERRALVYVAPILHLCACLTIALLRLESGWHYMTIVDFPVSILAIALSYNFHHPLILFGVIGTMWWYLLSLGIASCWKFLRSLRSES